MLQRFGAAEPGHHTMSGFVVTPRYCSPETPQVSGCGSNIAPGPEHRQAVESPMTCAEDPTSAGRLPIMTATFVCFAALLAACSDDPSSPAPAIGKLNVTVSTSGDDADTDGYLVIVDRSRQPVRVQANGSVAIYGLAVGSHSVDLGRGRSELCRRWRFGDRHHLASGRRCRHGPARHVFGVRQRTRVGGDHGH